MNILIATTTNTEKLHQVLNGIQSKTQPDLIQFIHATMNEDAHWMIEFYHPDIVIMDASICGGCEKCLAGLCRKDDIPSVFLYLVDSEEDNNIQRCVGNGIDFHIYSPSEYDKIETIIEHIIQKKLKKSVH